MSEHLFCNVCKRAIEHGERTWSVNRNLGEGRSMSWPTLCDGCFREFVVKEES